jgi:biopolymer transport protein ExbB
MITSASGLVVGIFAHIIYHILNILIERISFKMESNAMEFIDLLHEN